MANFYYVKSGGTATGDAGRVATTPSTGSFASKGASAYYDNISDALTVPTTGVASGDIIMVSDAHSHTYTVATTLAIPSGAAVVSVSDTNLDQYSRGAAETVDSGGSALDLNVSSDVDGALIMWRGVDLAAEDRVIAARVGLKCVFDDCSYHAINTGAIKGISLQNDGAWFIFRNSTINFSGTGHVITLATNGRIELDNCTGADTGVNNLMDLSGNGRATFKIINTDLSALMAASGNLVQANSSADDGITGELCRCKLPTGFTAISSPAIKGYEINITECDTGDGYHYFYYSTAEGTAEEDTTTYLNATYDGTNGFSAQLTSTADASPFNPLRYKLATIPAQDLTTAQTVTVECTSDASLADNDLWIEIVHNNNTDEALGDLITTQNADPLAAGTPLTTTGTGTWTSGDTEDYIITKDIGTLSNVDNGTVEVYVCVGAPGIVANFDLPTIAAT